MLDLIPEPKREPVLAALRASFDTDVIDHIEPLGGGLSAASVYRVVVVGRPYLLRLVTRVNAFNDPARHFACMTIAARAGLAPAVHYTDAAEAIAITDFIDCKPFAALERPRLALLADLAAAVRTLQATAPFPPLFTYLDAVDGVIAEVKARGLLPAAASEVFERYAALSAAYPRDPSELVSSHNDINPGNCLWDGQRLWLVDWEAAFLNDPYVDPACICNFFAATADDEQSFLTAYFGGPPTDHQDARIHLMRQVCHMFFAVVLLRMASAALPAWSVPAEALLAAPLRDLRRRTAELLTSPEGQIELAMSLLGEIGANTRAPRFTEALRIVNRR
ncbi:MAG TPA: phosphotransferase [Kofleriaceae bacterium]|nr:phosphotransferase [Kofleriaceae bacterium]